MPVKATIILVLWPIVAFVVACAWGSFANAGRGESTAFGPLRGRSGFFGRHPSERVQAGSVWRD
jgi:hypothetical protein